jgi:hypothetical protein
LALLGTAVDDILTNSTIGMAYSEGHFQFRRKVGVYFGIIECIILPIPKILNVLQKSPEPIRIRDQLRISLFDSRKKQVPIRFRHVHLSSSRVISTSPHAPNISNAEQPKSKMD